MTRRGRLANQAAGAQICQGVHLIDGNQARDATATHRHDDLGAVLDVLESLCSKSLLRVEETSNDGVYAQLRR